ncbi:HTH DNA binding domain protein [uncultured archaeon]|nr:HTH DNA binding domain protein [uncultured archaeon]
MREDSDEFEKKWRKEREKKLKAATIGFYHQGCQTSTSTEKFPHVRLEQVSPVIYFKRRPKWMDYSLLWNVRAERASELDEYLKYVKQRHDTKQLSVLDQSGKEALILIRFHSPSSSYEKVVESRAIPSAPVIAKDGFETYNLLALDPKSISKLAAELDEIGDVKLLRVGDYRRDDKGPALTGKQKDALQVALLNGYYGWPRRVGLAELAEAAKISRRSMQERLRRAEAKLFPKAVKDYLHSDGEQMEKKERKGKSR